MPSFSVIGSGIIFPVPPFGPQIVRSINKIAHQVQPLVFDLHTNRVERGGPFSH